MIPGISNVNLDLTTHCNLRCANCCAAVGLGRKLQHHPWEYFEEAAKVLYGAERINLSGGEPTFHPQFGEFVPKLKALFGCRVLAMVTDGWGVTKHFDVIKACFDEIDFSYYHTNPGAKATIQYHMPEIKLRIFDAGPNASNFTPRSQRGPGGPCERHWKRSGTIAYADGRIFGCCVAPGIEGAASASPSDLVSISEIALHVPEPPCRDCWWSE